MRINNKYIWENDLSLNDLVLKQKEEIKRLQEENLLLRVSEPMSKLQEDYGYKAEVNRLNNIINELKQKLNLAENILYDYLYKDKKITKELYDEFKELKGE